MESEPNRTNKENTIMKRALATVAASLGMGLAFDLLFIGKLPGISFPIFTALTIIVLLLTARLRHRELPKTALFMIPLLLFFSSMVFVRAGELVTFLNVIATLYLLALFANLVDKPHLWHYNFRDYFNLMFAVPSRVIEKAKEGLAPLATQRVFFAKHKSLPQVLRGVLIAVPVLLLFLVLFSSADLVFRQYLTDIFSFQVNGELLWRTAWVLAVAFVFVGLFGLFGQKAKPAKDAGSKAEGRRQYGLVEATILFGSLNVLFFSFIAVQLAYLFGGAANVAGDGFTYAEYARKGFFELVAVAGLSLVVIFITERLLLREGQKHSLRFKLLSGALIAQVMVVMASAIKRLHLYEGAYGFTTQRLYSYIFMIWLAVTFCVLLYKIFADRRENLFAFAAFVSLLVLLASINILNVEGFVARKNIQRYEMTGKLDVRYINTLSADAVPEIVQLLDSKDRQVRSAVATSLDARRQTLKTSDSSWQSANASRKAALQALDETKQTLEQNKGWQDPGYRGPGQE